MANKITKIIIIKNLAWWCVLIIQHWEGGDRQVPGAHWLVSQPSSRTVRDPVSKHKDDTQGCPLTSHIFRQTWTYAPSHTHLWSRSDEKTERPAGGCTDGGMDRMVGRSSRKRKSCRELGTCCHAWQPEFDLQRPHGRRTNSQKLS